jgi:ubiquinone/menaquinone biosynthesis C-methylase UbiE
MRREAGQVRGEIEAGEFRRQPHATARRLPIADAPGAAHIDNEIVRLKNPMAAPLFQLATRLAYGATQLPRVAWYVGHREIMRRLAEATRRRSRESASPRPRNSVRVPERWRLYADMAELFRADLANVEAGIYPLPADHDGSLPNLIERSRLFFLDLPQVHERRERGERREVLTEETRGRRPDYYLQNFHFQSGGWLTEGSAKRYDTQVEVLFNGSANAIRRQALPPLAEVFGGRDQRRLRLIDVGCGTGRFLDFVKQVWPRLPALGIDMSEAYIAEAKRHLRRRGWTRLLVGKGEAIPVADASQDAVTSIFVFHELPPGIRRAAFHEFARVLKPGGRLVIIDSLQLGDEPDYDGMLELFPQSFHEPYYSSYLKEDFGEIAGDCGLLHRRDVRAYVSKVMVFDKMVAS